MYYFQSGRRASAIVGSANFTEAAVTGNVEAALLVEGSHDDELLLSIRSMIESLWVNGSLIDSSFLESYKLQYEASRRYREVLSKPVRRKNSTENATYSNLLTMSWDDYVEAVKSEAVKSSSNHTLEGRLNVLRKSRLLLDEVNGFSDLSLEQRKAIAGIVGRKEKFGNELDNYDWAWFGSMFGAGSFKNRIAENDHHFTLALEHIPSIGEITWDDYQAFIKEFLRAFEFAERRGGVPTASRVLAMKRPDYFVCANKKNILKLSDDLGFKKTLDFDSYWMDIIEPITQAKWWQVRRPSGVEGRIWDGRAAMIDAIYYDPD